MASFRNAPQFQHFISKLKSIARNKFVKLSVPFLVFVVGGSFGLKQWTQIRYQFAPVKTLSNEEAEKMGLHKEKDVSLESVYEEIKNIDTENWENIRGPRPWESNLQNPNQNKSK